jgi:hypothetical protein
VGKPHWVLIALLATAAGVQARQRRHTVEVTTRETAALNPGGTVRIDECTNLDMRYDIKVPRTADLRVRHSVGEVNVQGVTGDIDVTNKVGEVALRLPEDVEFEVSARVKIGDVDSSIPGRSRRTHLVGVAFDNDRRGSRRVHARVTVGQIRLAPL